MERKGRNFYRDSRLGQVGIHRLLDWTVKWTSVVLTVPVTWTIAGDVFADIHSLPVQWGMRAAAVALVDGLLLRDWVLLDADTQAPIERKVRYAITVLVIYVGLLVLALYHHEGVAGLVFRTAMGLGVLSSIVSALSDTLRGLLDKAKHGAHADWRVQRHARRLSRMEACRQRESESEVRLAQIAASREVELRRIELEKARQLMQLEAAEPRRKGGRGRESPFRDERKFDLLVERVGTSPLPSVRQLAREIGVSTTTISRWLPEARLRANGKESPT